MQYFTTAAASRMVVVREGAAVLRHIVILNIENRVSSIIIHPYMVNIRTINALDFKLTEESVCETLYLRKKYIKIDAIWQLSDGQGGIQNIRLTS